MPFLCSIKSSINSGHCAIICIRLFIYSGLLLYGIVQHEPNEFSISRIDCSVHLQFITVLYAASQLQATINFQQIPKRFQVKLET